MSVKVIPDLFSKYVEGTQKDAIVQNVQVLLCNLTVAVSKGIGCDCSKVYISTRVLKHVYDKRAAEEFDFLIENTHLVVRYPDRVYKNKGGKRGDYCFVKELKNRKYICSVQEILPEKSAPGSHCEIATFFRVQKDSYLDNYELLWEWKGGKPSS